MTREELRTAFQELVNDECVSQALVLVICKDGRSFSADNGLTVNESEMLMTNFTQWINECLRKTV